MKTIIITFLSALIFSGIARESQAQNVLGNRIKWSANGFNDLVSNIWLEQDCFFVTYEDSKIDWVQGGDKLSLTFDVIKIDGKWKDISSDGSITYKFKLEDGDGKIVITKVDKELTLLFDLRGLESGDIINVYKITGVELQ